MNTVKITDYWYCKRCDTDSIRNEVGCPCPRGSCDAEAIGTVKTTVEVTMKPRENSIEPLGDVEELNCNTCDAVTGHHVINNAWTCVHCNTPKK